MRPGTRRQETGEGKLGMRDSLCALSFSGPLANAIEQDQNDLSWFLDKKDKVLRYTKDIDKIQPPNKERTVRDSMCLLHQAKIQNPKCREYNVTH